MSSYDFLFLFYPCHLGETRVQAPCPSLLSGAQIKNFLGHSFQNFRPVHCKATMLKNALILRGTKTNQRAWRQLPQHSKT